MIISILVVGIIGLLIGILLSLASIKFEVKVDENEEKIRTVLPGNNCGACGYPGCDGLACAIAKKEAPINQCPVGGEEVAKKIGEIMHLEVENHVHLVAYVKCKGTCDQIQTQYQYDGIHDCLSAAIVPGSGDKKCRFGCFAKENLISSGMSLNVARTELQRITGDVRSFWHDIEIMLRINPADGEILILHDRG